MMINGNFKLTKSDIPINLIGHKLKKEGVGSEYKEGAGGGKVSGV